MRADSHGGSVFCYGDEKKARICAAHLTAVNQSKIRRAHLVSGGEEQMPCDKEIELQI